MIIIILMIELAHSYTFNICKATGAQLDKKHWYEHIPKSAETSQGGQVAILWNQQVQQQNRHYNP
jgi:hypothetical protein